MNKLKELRKALSLKQGEFAQRISTTQGHISDIENGRKELSDRTIKLICLEFGVNEEWLRNGDGKMFIDKNSMSLDEYANSKNLTSLELDIIRAYMDLDKDIRIKLLNNLNNIFIKHNSDITVTLGNPSSSNDDIELEITRYRMELEAEKKGKISLASDGQKHA